MEKIFITFGDTVMEKHKFHQYKRPISIKNININKIVVSNKASIVKKGFKYFIGYKDAKKIRLLSIFLPEMSTYRKDSEYMSFLIKNDELLKDIIKFGKRLKIISIRNFIK